MVLMTLSLPMALIFLTVLHPDRTPVWLRYVYSITMGAVLGLFCFGWQQMAVLLAIIAVSYLLIVFIPPQHTQRYHWVGRVDSRGV